MVSPNTAGTGLSKGKAEEPQSKASMTPPSRGKDRRVVLKGELYKAVLVVVLDEVERCLSDIPPEIGTSLPAQGSLGRRWAVRLGGVSLLERGLGFSPLEKRLNRFALLLQGAACLRDEVLPRCS